MNKPYLRELIFSRGIGTETDLSIFEGDNKALKKDKAFYEMIPHVRVRYFELKEIKA